VVATQYVAEAFAPWGSVTVYIAQPRKLWCAVGVSCS
jgi:hypothetical protein